MSNNTLKEIALAYKNKTATPVSVVSDSLTLIDRVNGFLNIFLAVDKEGALSSAKAAEERMKKGENNPFLGIPICIPDVLNFPPFPTTYGSKLFFDYFPPEPAPELKRMHALGLVVLGKTNLSEFGLNPETQNLLLPPTRNPLDPSLSSGGPNGGSAAAVAAGICPMAFATDFSGSIRLSASFCQLTGFIPSRGIFPLRKDRYVPLTERKFMRKGFIAHTVQDIEMLFLPLANKVQEESKVSLRVAYSPNFGFVKVDPTVQATMLAFVEELASAGHVVELVTPKLDPSMLVQFQNIVAVDRLLIVRDALEKNPEREEFLTEKTKRWLKYAEGVSGLSYSYAETYLDWIKDKLDELLAPYDILLTPVSPVPPFPIGLLPDIISKSLVDAWVFTMPFNMSGHPVVSISGVQLVGKADADTSLLAAARVIQQSL